VGAKKGSPSKGNFIYKLQIDVAPVEGPEKQQQSRVVKGGLRMKDNEGGLPNVLTAFPLFRFRNRLSDRQQRVWLGGLSGLRGSS